VQACFFARFVVFFFFAALATMFMSTLSSSLILPSLSSLPRLRFFAGVLFASDFYSFTALSLLRLRFFGSAVVTSDFTSRLVTTFELMIICRARAIQMVRLLCLKYVRRELCKDMLTIMNN
jgi:hypothetical protein